MAVPLRLLLLASSERDQAWLEDTLRGGDRPVECVRVDDEAVCRTALEREHWDAVIATFEGPRASPALRALSNRDAGLDPTLLIVADAFEDAAATAQRLGATVCLRARGFAHLGPTLVRARQEREQRAARADDALERGHRAVLEHIAGGRSLTHVLEEIVRLVEAQGDGMLCSILLLDAEAGRMRHGAAPHLPRELVQGIDGAAIGPREGSCGAAAYLRQTVVVDDIGTHPNWTSYRQLALPFGLRACWSSPIFAPGGDVLGTFAMYYGEARTPTRREQTWVARATHLAAIAIGRDRAERAARRAESRYRQIVDTAREGVWLLDVDARTLFVNQRTAKMLGFAPEELLGRRIVDFMDEASRSGAEGGFIERLGNMNEQFEFKFRRKDGTVFPAFVAGSPLHDDKHAVVGALGMITDITSLKRTEEALRKSEAELRVVFENAAIGMALLDDEGRLVKSNLALQQFLGRDERELAAIDFRAFSHPEDAENDLQLLELFRHGARHSYQSERRFIRKDGAILWGRITVSTVQPQKGIRGYAIAMVENVTERREMEEAVRTSERLRALMYGAVADVLFYIGVEPGRRFRFLSVNPAFTRATGLAEAQVVGRAIDDVIPLPSREVVVANYARAIQERRTITWDEITPYPAGVKYGEVSITPVFDDGGTCTNLVGTVHDVTERRLAEQRVRAQAALLDKARDAILLRDLDGVVRYWNEGAERLYGWSSAEAIGRSLLSHVYDETNEYDAAQQQLIRDGHWSGELVQKARDGKRLVVEASWTLIKDEAGARSVLVINSDITARKNLEAQVFHAQRLESLGTLAGGFAHDFSNLLMVVSANVEDALEMLAADHQAREGLNEVLRATNRGADLVRQLLTFSRRDEPKLRPVKLEPLVSEALRLMRVTFPRTVHLETRFDPDVPEILGDGTQIHQIVMNLCTNAVHAMGIKGGPLSVRLERAVVESELAAHVKSLRTGTYARLVVADSGRGMDAATLDHIFDPFFTTKPAAEGTGLGLSVVHGIVRNHDGSIVVRSAPGRGTEFELYFPAGLEGRRKGAQHAPQRRRARRTTA
jgi:PAS domain S-box-containing protein